MNLLIVDDEYLVVEEVVTVTDWGDAGYYGDLFCYKCS